MRLHRSIERGPRQRGQSLVEFALVLIPALLLMLGTAQFGLMLGTQVGLTNTARDVARWAATIPTATAAQASANGTSAYNEMLTRLPANVPMYGAGNLKTPGSGVSYCSYTDPLGNPAVQVTVTVQYRHPLFFPLLSNILDGIDGDTDGALTIGTTESMHVENDSSAVISGLTTCP